MEGYVTVFLFSCCVFIFVFISQNQFPSLLSFQYRLLRPPPPTFTFSHLFLFRKREASHVYQPAMAYQVEVILGTFCSIKAGQINPVR